MRFALSGGNTPLANSRAFPISVELRPVTSAHLSSTFRFVAGGCNTVDSFAKPIIPVSSFERLADKAAAIKSRACFFAVSEMLAE